MPFVNEYISKEDAEKYGLAEIDKKIVGGNESRDWTIDRDRDIYLRNVAQGHHETSHESLWTFYWNGVALTLRLDLMGTWGKPGAPGGANWTLVFVNGSYGLPPALKASAQKFLSDLEEALITYKDGGVFSVKTEYGITLQLADGCVL